jgi:hypothetical protein
MPGNSAVAEAAVDRAKKRRRVAYQLDLDEEDDIAADDTSSPW